MVEAGIYMPVHSCIRVTSCHEVSLVVLAFLDFVRKKEALRVHLVSDVF